MASPFPAPSSSKVPPPESFVKADETAHETVAEPLKVVMDSDLTEEQQEVIDLSVRWALGSLNTEELKRFNPKVLTVGGLAGTGKASACSANVYTPFGPKRMGDIKKGDQVSNPDGSVARVIQVFPQGVQDVFKVTFSDGAATLVTREHLWRVTFGGKKYKAKKVLPDGLQGEEIVDTGFLINYIDKNNHKNRNTWPSVPITEPVVFTLPDRGVRFSMDPYLLGLLLGDGSFRDGMLKISSVDGEILDHIRENFPFTLNQTTEGGCDYRMVGSSGEKGILERWGLWGLYSHEKFVPKHYLTSSVESRWELLRGLMDTDGTVDQRSDCSFCSTSIQLAQDVQWLVRSLGGKATISSKLGKYRKPDGRVVDCKVAYNVHIAIRKRSLLFKLGRKRLRCRDETKGWRLFLRRRIVSIEPAGREECQCIQVSHPNGLYITDDFIVTHNTTISRKIRERISKHISTATAAFTGRAVSVLKRKGITDATTLHSLMYYPEEDEKGNLEFKKRDSIPAEVVLVDEGSMVNLAIHRDLLDFDVKVIYIGDHGQLEPIGDNPKLMTKPDLVLERIHRNAGAIAQFAHRLRKVNTYFPLVENNQVRVRKSGELMARAVESDVTIVGYNRTRHRVNKVVREAKGFTTDLPGVGERIICLQNNRDWGVYNGLILRVTRVVHTDEKIHVVNAEDGSGKRWLGLPTLIEQYGNNDMTKDRGRPKGYIFADFAYCLTCHKAQGGEWAKVTVLEESAPNWDMTKWSYTAASRPFKQLTWCR